MRSAELSQINIDDPDSGHSSGLKMLQKYLETGRVLRLVKLSLLAFFGAYAALVALANFVDPESNLMFIEHVLSMDTTFQRPALMGRAVTSPLLHQLALWTITFFEVLIAALCFWGAWRLMRALPLSAGEFHAAKGPGIAGLLLGLAIWFFGFQVVGGEWFASWQSLKWHGFEPAGRVMNFLLGSLILISLRDDEHPSDSVK